ncbi:MAG TPA: PDR/VanB family oxidoreductase [Dongiaceae bacterium]|nr:PDR/VanB family oxidoreductase [Dongiaceae bacterium]
MSKNVEHPVEVAAITPVADTVKRFHLVSVDGKPLPYFSGGSHVVVTMRGTDAAGAPVVYRNPYSLMSSPNDPGHYEISVLRVLDSRGGSHFMHDRVKVGDRLILSNPVNLFPVNGTGRKHIFVAGGIGITPFMAMMDGLASVGGNFELHYGFRSRSHGAYWRELQERYGANRVNLYCEGEGQMIDVDHLLEHQPLGTNLYICGPAAMIAFFTDKARLAGWPEENIHSEQFLAPPSGKPFLVRLQKSKIEFMVGEHQSILEAIEAHNIDANFLCRGGACGQCETSVCSADGEIQHNDHYLTDDDRQSGKKIMICVSRFKGGELVLDL